jgi:hypothetical protein
MVKRKGQRDKQRSTKHYTENKNISSTLCDLIFDFSYPGKPSVHDRTKHVIVMLSVNGTRNKYICEFYSVDI